MAWIFLLMAGLLEIGFALGLKQSEGFTRPWPTLWTFVLATGSLYLLTVAIRTIPLGTAYAVWTGIGALGTVLIGIVFFGESVDWARLLCLGLVLAGLVGLRLVSPH